MDYQLSTILLYLLYTIGIVQGIFLLIIFPRLLFFNKTKTLKDKTENLPGVSVVIAAKDEYPNLKKFLPQILNQDYPNFEIIVVNNGSEDDSEFLLKEMQNDYPNLKYINVKSDANFFEGKKFPLSIGIKSAKNEILLLTDADCYPSSPNWISNFVNTYDPKTEIILGYGGYETRKGLLNKIIRFDTIRVALLYFSFATWKIPYMGVGRNLSYRKSLFYSNGGFTKHYKIPSGDDDLFINQVATRKNTAIIFNADSKTISVPKESFSDWFKQKRRHFTTGKLYKKWHIFLLGLWETSTILYFFISILMLALKINIEIVLYFIGIRTIVSFFIVKKLLKSVNERKLLLLSPLLELTIVVLGIIINLSNLLYKQRKWK